jgi:hypothetical protein
VDIPQARLANQLLGRKKCQKPAEVVTRLGAAQAQDFAAAKWALGMRMDEAAAADVEKAFDKGEILRTHVMRPTWHLVAPQDIRILLALTAPRVHAANAHMYRKLELDDDCLARCRAVLKKALRGNNYLTRSELANRLSENRIEAAGQRLAYILMHAELEALICSGPRRGKQFTYALLDERAPQAQEFERDEALARWTLRGLNLAARQLAYEIIDDKTYWFSPDTNGVQPRARAALLLSIYDEYIIGYRDRNALGGERYVERLLSMGNALTSVLILDGKIAGTWKRIVKGGGVEIATNSFRQLRKGEHKALRTAAASYGEFLQIPIVLS